MTTDLSAAEWAAAGSGHGNRTAGHGSAPAGGPGPPSSGPDTALSSRVVTFPEAVALAEILTDPDWRHHVATAPRQAGQSYRRISARLGEGTYQPPADYDPVVAWAQHHRSHLTGRESS